MSLRQPAAAAPSASKPELRLALFTGNYNYIKDGVALTLNRLVGFLERRGIPVLVIAPTGPTPAFEAIGELISVPSLPIPFRSEYRISLGLSRKARRRLEAFRPTLFHIAVPDILGYQALKLAGIWKVPVVASFHTRYDTYLKFYGLDLLESLGRKYFGYFYNKCAQVYPPSESMADIIRAEGFSQNVRVWSRGVDAEHFNPANRSLDWRRSLGLADDEVIVVFVGRLVKEKNTGILVRIFDALAKQGTPFRAMIVGDGPEEARMKAALPNGIFTGFLHGDALARAYASADVFLFPSESETFGNVTLEAMASGLPSVCANASGSRSLVVDGVTGYLVDPASEAAYVVKLGDLVRDSELRAKMGQDARARAQSFSWDHILDGLLENYYEVIRNNSVSRASHLSPAGSETQASLRAE
jgi:phosphatidylinositol alpha 1,6-mannosyltransferase